MTRLLDVKDAYGRFIAAAGDRLHFAAHSHHYWLDASREAHVRAWDDAARLVDGKWDHVFSEVLPAARARIARVLGLADPKAIALAPNTHEFVLRLLSCLEQPRESGRKLRVLTTDGEFYSFARQIARLEELPGAGGVEVTRVACEPWATFEDRFVAEASRGAPDFVFFSQVFFNSGLVVRDLHRMVAAAPAQAMVVIDGYHGFMAMPTDLASVRERAFYVAGGYKYAQAGEGACFLHVPDWAATLRPVNTGWFAEFADLSGGGTRVGYSPARGDRFAGSTFDPTAWYRFIAAHDELERRGASVARIHEHVRVLQRHLMTRFADARLPGFGAADLVVGDIERAGHFLTFRNARAGEVVRELADLGVTTDSRGDRLRFGFGIYQDLGDVDELVRRVARLVPRS